MRNLLLASSDEALYIRFGLGHSKTNVTANIDTISGFSFDGRQIGKPRFAMIVRGKLNQRHGGLVAEDWESNSGLARGPR